MMQVIQQSGNMMMDPVSNNKAILQLERLWFDATSCQ
jgi:hypothetical protein